MIADADLGPASTAPIESARKRPQTAPRIKSFCVAEVRHAMAAARRELGEDAVLIQTKCIDPPVEGAKYEVTFGVTGIEATEPEESLPSTEAVTTITPSRTSTPGAITIEAIRADLAALHAILSRPWGVSSCESEQDSALTDLRNRLVAQGIKLDLADQWTTEIRKSGGEAAAGISPTETTSRLLEVLNARIQIDASLGWDASHGKAALLVGPPGSGKTTALLKLTLEYGIKRGRKVEVWSLNAGTDVLDAQLQSFTRLLNITLRSFTSARGLADALGKVRLDECLVLIDTRGFGQSMGNDAELASTLGTKLPLQCHLVLDGAADVGSIAHGVHRFEIFHPHRLLFTKVDISTNFGPLLQEPWRTRKPLSFVSSGPLGSGTVQPADLKSIVNWLKTAPKS